MKVFQINVVAGNGSTGKIVTDLADVLAQNGSDCCIAFGRGSAPNGYVTWKIGNDFDQRIHGVATRLFDAHGFKSSIATRKLIRQIQEYNPDVIQLHNLHGYYLNVELLFKYLKRCGKPVIWTLHDCWAFTGHCAYFSFAGCSQWQTECERCPQPKSYPKCIGISNVSENFKRKKAAFLGVPDLTIVTPSEWLAGLAKQSFLKEYQVKVINNGIDLEVFKPRKSDFRKKYQCEDKIVLLGVAFGWGQRKGLDIFVQLAKRLPEQYQIVLVGTDERVEAELPGRILSIRRTNNQQELAEIYSAADLFVNPTREDNYPTVNMEALACGTPVLTFRVGGSPEALDETCGSVVERDDVDVLEKEIIRICAEHPFSPEACVLRAKSFNKKNKFQEYIELYNSKTGNIGK